MGRWLYLQEIWPQTRKLWIACIIRLPCPPALSNGGWTCFWRIFVSLDIGPYCALSSMSPFRLPEPTAALLASSKKDASHKLGVSPKWYCDILCMSMCVFVSQSSVLYHFITATTCRLTSSIDLYSIFQSCSAGGWRSRHLRIGGIQTVVCQFDWTPLLGKSTQITCKSTTEGSSEVTCTDTWA